MWDVGGRLLGELVPEVSSSYACQSCVGQTISLQTTNPQAVGLIVYPVEPRKVPKTVAARGWNTHSLSHFHLKIVREVGLDRGPALTCCS